jgi:hypothetical protein
MSTRKSKDQNAEQPPPPKDHSPEQVKQVALMLYARQPLPSESGIIRIGESEWEYDSLVREAFDLLDNLDKAYARVGKLRRHVSDLPRNALGKVQYNAAVMFFTEEKHRHVDRAKKKFETVLLGKARGIDRVLGTAAKQEQQTREKIADWEKNGMTLGEVEQQYVVYSEKAYRRYRETGEAEKRKPRTKAQRATAIGQTIKEWSPEEKTEFREIAEAQLAESAARKAEKKKLKALRKVARTGEIK